MNTITNPSHCSYCKCKIDEGKTIIPVDNGYGIDEYVCSLECKAMYEHFKKQQRAALDEMVRLGQEMGAYD